MREDSRWIRGAIALAAAAAVAAGLGLTARAQTMGTHAANPLAALHFRFIGPRGNRLDSIIGEPGNPNVIYVGAADGGIWKSEDGGTSWRPIFDRQDVSPVGALAMAPSDHNTIWAGTGEPWLIRPYWALGDGVYKSVNAGKTWQHMGLDATGHIARIVVDPHDANRVFVCAIGQAFREQHERGIFRTLDGGKTWQQVLFVNEKTGCSELAMDPHDSDTLFAGMWPDIMHGWNNDSGGPGGGVYVSHDGGTTWHKLSGHGLPAADQPIGKTAVAIAPSDSNRVYALLQENPPRLYRSEDGGENWTLVNQSHLTAERGPYYTRMVVAPDNENVLYFPSVAYSISSDGGTTLLTPNRATGTLGQASAGGDNHDIWIDPTNPDHILEANDQGVSISVNHGRSFLHEWLPISQAYHVATDNDVPYHVTGNLQDDGSFRIPSRVLSGGFGGGGIPLAEITGTAGCEDGFAIPDPKDSNVVWGGCDNGRVYRMDYRTGMSREVTPWPVVGIGFAPKDVKYRWNWVSPIAIDPLDHNRVYTGAQVVFMTTDGGQSWKVVSPDLTTDTKSHEGDSGGLSVGNTGTFAGATLFALAASPVKEGVIWAGTTDGQVSVTENGGANWTNVTRNMPNLPPWGRVEAIQPSHFDAATAYAAVSLQLMGDYNAYVYKTTDYGKTWNAHQRLHPQVGEQLRQDDRGGSRPQGHALSRHRKCPLCQLGRRRPLDPPAQQSAAGPRLLGHHPADVQRSRPRHLRPWRAGSSTTSRRSGTTTPRGRRMSISSSPARRTASAAPTTSGRSSPLRMSRARTRRTAPISTSGSSHRRRTSRSRSPVPTSTPSARSRSSRRARG